MFRFHVWDFEGLFVALAHSSRGTGHERVRVWPSFCGKVDEHRREQESTAKRENRLRAQRTPQEPNHDQIQRHS